MPYIKKTKIQNEIENSAAPDCGSAKVDFDLAKKHEKIIEPVPLLDEKGRVLKPGYAVDDLYIYDRKHVKAPYFRLKEWDFYQLSNDKFCVQFTFGHVTYGGTLSVTAFDFETGSKNSVMIPIVFPGREGLNMPLSGDKPHRIDFKRKNVDAFIDVTPETRKLFCKAEMRGGKGCDIDISLDNSGRDSMYIATPFEGLPRHFYYNQKKNCMKASGRVQINGVTYDLSDNTYALMDWGRGVWPYRQEWWWGNGSTLLPNGHLFGFNIGWGFGNLTNASENMLFYDGIAHKIDRIHAEVNTANYMRPWHFCSSDGRFMMNFTPIFDNFTETNLVIAHNCCHQVFGKWNGYALLDDGTRVEVKDMVAFCEHAKNRW